ncbi:MAG: response regulator [Myxococcales bacterium]|nr:response regulator [Myxococcales bacterium]
MAASEVADLQSEVARLHRRVAELEQRSSHDLATFFASLLQALPAVVVWFDAELKIRFVSNLVAGLREEDVVGKPALDFVSDDTRSLALATIQHSLSTGETGSYETIGPGPHDQPRRYKVFVTPAPSSDGSVGGCLVALDISVLVERERALAEAEQKLRIALASTKLGLWSWEMATGEVLWDEGMRQVMGRTEPLDLPAYVELAAHPDDRAAVRESGEQALATGQFDPVTHRIVRPDGEVRWVLSMGELQSDASGRPVRFVGGNLDITGQRDLEERLRLAHKMEAVGRLTAGVAHNFNNMLMVVMPSLDLLRKVVPVSHATLLDHAAGASERAADMVRKLMTFAGQRRRVAPGLCDVGELARRITSMCERTFDRHIALRCEIAPDGLRVRADEGDLEQVVMNLLLNARDAVLEAGREHPVIEISVTSREGDPRLPGTAPLVAVVVQDNGAGMSDLAMSHAFEPFFTSKDVGRGTGLGLATSYAIARDLGGLIELDSTLGVGTTATVLLPASTTVLRQLPTEPPPPPAPANASVLVIDDEPLILRLVAESLAELGYRVHTADSGGAALAVLEREPVAVILLDRSMPGTPGSALLASLRARAPRSKIAYFTGQEVAPAEQAEVDAVIQKPVRVTELARILAGLSS